MAIAQNQAVAISVESAARMLNISRSLAWNLVWEGKLRSVKLGRRRLVPIWQSRNCWNRDHLKTAQMTSTGQDTKGSLGLNTAGRV